MELENRWSFSMHGLWDDDGVGDELLAVFSCLADCRRFFKISSNIFDEPETETYELPSSSNPRGNKEY
jgi:hypothetical protein